MGGGGGDGGRGGGWGVFSLFTGYKINRVQHTHKNAITQAPSGVCVCERAGGSNIHSTTTWKKGE